ncbi:MAG: exo-alpha-sialidase [Ardenticatenaceae bacterium]|nr:exo-alpha-sialidase [Ardenticatenaceae bacterium]
MNRHRVVALGSALLVLALLFQFILASRPATAESASTAPQVTSVDGASLSAGRWPSSVDLYTLNGVTAPATATPGNPSTATPTPTPTATAVADQCVRDVNTNGRGDIVDIMAAASAPGCAIYLPNIISLWQQPWPSPTPTSTPDGSHGASANWRAEVQVSNTGGASVGAVGRTLAVDSQNHLHVVWTENSGASFDVYYARSIDGGKTWSASQDIANSPLPAVSPNIAVGPDDTLHAVWNDRRAGGTARLYYSRSFDGGTTWETPRDLTGPNSCDTAGASLSVDDRNRVHLAWHVGTPAEGEPPTQVFYTRSLDAGDTFETPRRLNSTEAHAAWPRFSVEGTTGDLIAIAWRDNRRNPDWDIYLAVSADGGTTFTERVGQASSNRDWDPDVTVDPAGVIHLSLMTYRAGGAGVAVDYQRSTDQGRTWSPPMTLSEAFSRFPFWAPDHDHGVLWLFWKDERDLGSAGCSGENHCADIAGKYSTDGGQTWSEMEFVTDLGSTEVKFPSPAVGPDGRPHVVWSDQRYGPSQEAMFVRSRLTAPAGRLAVTPAATGRTGPAADGPLSRRIRPRARPEH